MRDRWRCHRNGGLKRPLPQAALLLGEGTRVTGMRIPGASLGRTFASYEGWTMVAIAFLCVAFGFGASTATMPLIYSDVMKEFGWTRTETTLIFTYKNIAGAAMAMFLVGPLFVRFGLRPVMLGSIIITGLGMISFLWVHSLLSFLTLARYWASRWAPSAC